MNGDRLFFGRRSSLRFGMGMNQNWPIFWNLLFFAVGFYAQGALGLSKGSTPKSRGNISKK